MQISHHAVQRMSQRGITKEMLQLVLEYEEVQGDKTWLTKEVAARLVVELQREIEILQQDLKVAKKIMDKGGVAVVFVEDEGLDGPLVVTTHNNNPRWKRKWGKRCQHRAKNSVEGVFATQRDVRYE